MLDEAAGDAVLKRVLMEELLPTLDRVELTVFGKIGIVVYVIAALITFGWALRHGAGDLVAWFALMVLIGFVAFGPHARKKDLS